ncbi:mediator complex subunit MED6 Ecym_3202 [Eremothecium cymbalariae DBVPG|uniref:Mediator of RNA polymerase II transcription subunit 6 n=1 Tax=Eremothecium cymbalariae (strain CBS 270.75 / DBVPG 7215 / KCTC 17166 / NRRL Y-17582) TaxID=931890 RepID=G8JRD2_ERECY|nr:Hypothetical protein Ecym_3202 [Eremothecium cymbalariae DBVPG\
MSLLPLDEVQWKSPEWIQSFGLRTENVLDYFSQSPFFDKTSNNQVVKMQQQFSQQLAPSSSQQAGRSKPAVSPQRQEIWDRYPSYALLEQELAKLKGVEYILAHVREPDFWVIRKQNRQNEINTTPLNDYYIIGANVYQSPTVYKVVHNRLLSTNYHLSKALAGIQQLSTFQPSQGSSFIAIEHDSVLVASSPATGSTAAVTGSAGNTTGATNVGMTAAMETNGAGYSDILTQEMMDKLMLQSIKSTPVYL